ncbi:SDR family oxidoreductase [Microbacterium sp. APC 3898]|uniref:SDR family oxidoreductase n=1 Tax=Planococcus notacanthi TaxID=3035188 RepID=A0ABT7ZHB7_9BACL|nr:MULTISPECIES: SDR family oxidoreductase [Terrabacteria group]MDN3426560.1 SDR family oxidoreductase [Planococcus sp. APC 4016]MDN3500477.1 SDR family oxidoreductase [Microbacterium sp. APC 3898]
MRYNITAATGNLGSKIVEEALKHIAPEKLILTVRNPHKAAQFQQQGIQIRQANYRSEQELASAFKDTDVLIYIPSLTFPSVSRIMEFENAMIAAEKMNVKQFLFIGFMADQGNNPFKMSPFFGYVQRRLASGTVPYTYICNGMYSDPLPPYLPELARRGKILYPVADERISFISRKDLSTAIVQIALREDLHNQEHTLTGTKAWSMEELAQLFTQISGSPIVYAPLSNDEFASTYDEPKGFGSVLASLYQAAAKGLMSEVTDDFERITGKPAENLDSYVGREYRKLMGSHFKRPNSRI